MTNSKKKFYVKATGDNRYAAGTSRWLRIKDIKFNTEEERSEIKVRFQGDDRYVDVYDYESNPPNLKFALGSPKGMPVSWQQVKQAFQQKNESKAKLTKSQLKEMIREEVVRQLNEGKDSKMDGYIEIGELLEKLGLEKEVNNGGDISNFWNIVPPGTPCILKSKSGATSWPEEVPDEPKFNFDFDESWNKPRKINLWGYKRSRKNAHGFLYKTEDFTDPKAFIRSVTPITIVIPDDKIVTAINPLSTLHKIYVSKKSLRRGPYR